MPAISLSVGEVAAGGGLLSGAVLASGGVSEVVAAGADSGGWDAEVEFLVGAVEFADFVDDVKERVAVREVVGVKMLRVDIGNEDV